MALSSSPESAVRKKGRDRENNNETFTARPAAKSSWYRIGSSVLLKHWLQHNYSRLIWKIQQNLGAENK